MSSMLYINARFLTQEMTGVQRFSEQICLALKELRDDIVFLAPSEILRPEIAKKLNVKIIGNRQGHLWEQIDLPKYLKSIGSPTLLNLCSTAPIFYNNKVVTHHDVTYKRYPDSFSRKFRLMYALLIPMMLKKSKHLITVSEFSKKEINEVYKYPLNKTSIIYNAVSDEFSEANATNLDHQAVTKERYLLAVSSPNYHKNFHGMLSAFSELKTPNIKLKIIGKAGNAFTAQSYSPENKEHSNVEFMGRVDDQQLIELYQNAYAFVFPSFYEGFGIPPLEAQACGCPVIASNTASMPEVLGNSVLYFNPENVLEIKKAMEEITTNQLLREELRQKGRENTKRFSWKDSAIKVNDIVNKITNG